MSSVNNLSGAERATLVFLALDEELATTVLRFMSEADVLAILNCAEHFEPKYLEALDPTFGELEKMMKNELHLHSRQAGQYLRDLVGRALGREKAAFLTQRPENEHPAIRTIKAARAQTLSDLLADEHPQIAAVIISQLPKDRAAKVLGGMSEEKQGDIVARMASLTEVSEDMIAMASDALVNALEAAGATTTVNDQKEFDGVSYVASILNEMARPDSERLLGSIEDQNAEVGPKIRQAMFTFEDLLRVNMKGVQILMRELSTEQVLVALKTASEELREHFFSAVSSRAALAMREDLAILPPMRLSDVEQAQREVVEVAQRLAAEGKLTLPGSGSEKLV